MNFDDSALFGLCLTVLIPFLLFIFSQFAKFKVDLSHIEFEAHHDKPEDHGFDPGYASVHDAWDDFEQDAFYSSTRF